MSKFYIFSISTSVPVFLFIDLSCGTILSTNLLANKKHFWKQSFGVQMYSFVNVSEPKKRRSHSCCLWMTSTPTGPLWQTTWVTQVHAISRWYQKQIRETGTKKDKRYDSHLIQKSFITLRCCIFQVTVTFDFYTWPPPNWVQLQIWFRKFILRMASHRMADQMSRPNQVTWLLHMTLFP